jgi:transglutaminase-like putative cysteine protease
VKYRVRHSTAYSYRKPVDLASHMLHLLPRAMPHQVIASTTLQSIPKPVRSTEALDHFGNQVTWLFLDMPHAAFEVTMEAVVDVAFPRPPEADETPPWEAVAAAARAGGPAWQASEFTFDSPMVPLDPTAGAYAAISFPPGRPILAGLKDLTSRVRREFAFRAGVTTISTPVSKVMQLRAGVCQDFTHVMVSGLRCLGLPARYVSGYIRTYTPPGGKRRMGSDQSHAWVGCWLGPAFGWIDLDPTNGLVVADEHVVLGWGRDYSDTCPVRGVILGGGDHSVSGGVDLLPAEDAGHGAAPWHASCG